MVLEDTVNSDKTWQDKRQRAQIKTHQIASGQKKTLFLLWAWSNIGAGCAEMLWGLHPWWYSEPVQSQSWATCSCWACLSAWVGDHKSSLPASAVLWFWQLSGTIRACYRILKWRSARTYQMKVDWEGTTALYFPTLNFWGKKDHFTLSASRNTMSDTKCIMQPFYSISLLFHVRWASSIILLPVELFWCAFDCMWCT